MSERWEPRAEYERRLAARRTEAARHAEADRRIANLRPFVFLLAGVVGWLAIGMRWFSPAWLLGPLLLFLALVIYHDQVIQKREAIARIVAFYERGLARLDGRWPGTGVTGERFRDPAHPYADDLDLFGRESLFELLCTARTSMGQETLARWLMNPAEAATVRERQAAVADLRPRLDLRESLALHGEAVRSAVDIEALVAWATAPVKLTGKAPRVIAGVLAALTVAALLWWIAGQSPLPLVGMVILEQVFVSRWAAEVGRVVNGVDQPGRDLAVFSHLLARLEGEQFQSPRLRTLCAGLGSSGMPPSQRLARLQKLVSLLQSQRNGIFALIAFVLLWPFQLAFAIEEWRAECGAELPRWLEVAGEFEALSSLASHAYEHPDDPFPEVVEEGAFVEAEGAAHPLLPESRAIRNSASVGGEVRLLIISGSNMSGKSTLMRTLGTNIVLALAGGTVRAHRFRLSPLAVGASIRVQDSLQQGASRFYAEITRLRLVVDLASGKFPLFFLLDEILHGTNSHDRRIGAEAVVRGLVARGAIGLVSTHDLALARIAEDPALQAVNVHFEDHLEDGQMRFDYQLRPGIVQKSNALELMRAVGLDV